MQPICVVGNGLNSGGPLKRLLFYQKHSLPFDDGGGYTEAQKHEDGD